MTERCFLKAVIDSWTITREYYLTIFFKFILVYVHIEILS